MRGIGGFKAGALIVAAYAIFAAAHVAVGATIPDGAVLSIIVAGVAGASGFSVGRSRPVKP